MFTPDHSRSSSPTHMGATRLPDWTFAQHELLEKAGYDISKKFEEKEKEFEIKEKLFEMRSVDCGGGGLFSLIARKFSSLVELKHACM